ncbi:MAG: hypothetical protein AAGG68_01665 [Bacteroidota bacterium]
MEIKLEDVLGHNDKKYIRILRLLQLIEGVNQSLDNSRKLKNRSMLRQYEHLKRQYTSELLELLAEYELPVQLAA